MISIGFDGLTSTSTNKADNWSNMGKLPSFISGVACSADASRVVAISSSGPIYTSTNFCSTWISNYVSDERFPGVYVGSLLSGVACSADGSNWAACAGMANGTRGPLYFSTNGAISWNPATAPVTNWVGICSSADGAIMYASTASDGPLTGANAIYRSTDFGVSWTRLNAPTPWWRGLATSADGGRVVVAAIGPIYTAQAIRPPTLRVVPSSNAVSISWIASSTNFVLQESPAPVTADWTDITDAPAFDATTLRNVVIRPATASQGFYRMVLRP
jgi:photosystem II stability/assembly factor-like uncharacterized protein